MIKITPDQPLDYNWKGHGFRVYIPAGAINSSHPLTMFIQASLSGNYQLPDNGTFVSGVYSLSFHSPVKNFNKNITLAIEHCASDDDSQLSFVTAEVAGNSSPYIFKQLPGGLFSKPGVGYIEVEHFTLFGIELSWGKVTYALCTYFIRKQRNYYHVHITVTQNLGLQLNVSRINCF